MSIIHHEHGYSPLFDDCRQMILGQPMLRALTLQTHTIREMRREVHISWEDKGHQLAFATRYPVLHTHAAKMSEGGSISGFMLDSE